MDEGEHSCCHEKGHAHGPAKEIWYKSPFYLICFGTFLLFGASFLFPLLFAFRQAFIDYLRIIWFPVGLGFLFGGIIDHYIPNEYFSKYLARKNKKTIFYAVGLGFLATACSHGVIALSMELHKKGASGPAVISFLLASPWASLPITLLLIGFFGAKAFVIILAALVVALTTGLIMQVLEEKQWIEKNKFTITVSQDFSIRKDIRKRIREYQFNFQNVWFDIKGVALGARGLARMVLHWILLGMVLASLSGAFVPSSIFHRFLGPSLFGLLMTLVLATVLEVCSEGTSPLAFEIYKQTGAFGNAFAFLLGGVITDFTEVSLVWANLGKKTALWMLAIALPQVLIFGWLFNHL